MVYILEDGENSSLNKSSKNKFETTELDDILKETQYGDIQGFVDFLYRLNIPEAEPLQKLFHEASKRPAVFPTGLTKQAFAHKLEFVYNFDMNKYKAFYFKYFDTSKEHRVVLSRDEYYDKLYDEYKNDTSNFIEKLLEFTSKPYDLIIDDQDKQPELTEIEMNELFKDLEKLDGFMRG